MRNHRGWGLPLTVICLLGGVLTGCAHSQPGETSRARRPSPIAVSIAGRGVYLVDPATGSRRDLVDHLPDFRSGYAAWSPDHQDLAYSDGGIVVMDPKTNGQTVYVHGKRLSMPVWDPDGSHVAYTDGLSLWLTSLGRVVPARIHVPAILAPFDLAWSSTDTIAFQGVELDCSQAVRCVSTGSSEIWTVRSNDTNLVELTDVGHADSPKWSPNGSRLLFVRHYPASHRSQLWTIAAAGGPPQRLIGATDVVAADWSPDGTGLAVLTAAKAGSVQLWVGRADGSKLRRVGQPLAGSTASIDW